jgi:hypothetical protein
LIRDGLQRLELRVDGRPVVDGVRVVLGHRPGEGLREPVEAVGVTAVSPLMTWSAKYATRRLDELAQLERDLGAAGDASARTRSIWNEPPSGFRSTVYCAASSPRSACTRR